MMPRDRLEENVLEAEASGDPKRIEEAYDLLKRQRVASARMRQDYGDDPEVEAVLGGRQSGKTVRAIEWVKAGRTGDDRSGTRTMIVMTRAMGHELRYAGLFPDEVISYRELRNAIIGGRRFDGREFGVDESAAILAELLGIRSVSFMTVLTRNPT